MGMVRKSLVGVVVAGLLALDAGAAWSAHASGGHPASPASPAPHHTPGSLPSSAVRLVSYGGCDQVLAGMKAEAEQEVGPYGWTSLGPGYSGLSPGVSTAPSVDSGASLADPTASPAATASGSSNSVAAPGYSTTNDQEAGVDEADIVKTDGHLLLDLRSQPAGLEVADVSAGVPHLDSSLPLPGEQFGNEGLLLVGDYVVVLSAGEWTTSPTGQNPSETKADIISLADPVHPSIVRTFEFEGQSEGARLINGQVVLVLENTPELPFVTPSDASQASASVATATNKAVIAASTLSDWLPGIRVFPGGTTIPASCADTVRSTVASGLGTVSVVSFAPTSTSPGHEMTFVGNAQSVYASTTAVYVAATSWADQTTPALPPDASMPPTDGSVPPSYNTDIYGFSISAPSVPAYLGSAQVPGELIGQYAMSEYDGDLRVATTVGAATPSPGEGATPTVLSDNEVTVLAPTGQQLVPIGKVTGLGRGEKIYAVRYEGPLAYVVTFNQTDPLYVIDLSNPSQPVLEGSVALAGYSSFLQPLGGGQLFGIGESVSAGLARTGLQLSVFDVTDPKAPALLSRVDLADTNSPAESDPHALLWWPANRLLAFPVTSYQTGQDALDVWHVGASGSLDLVSQLSQPAPETASPPDDVCAVGNGDGAASGGDVAVPVAGGGATVPSPCYSDGGAGIERALVVGPDLWSVSEQGIMANDMTTWTRDAWLPFSG